MASSSLAFSSITDSLFHEDLLREDFLGVPTTKIYGRDQELQTLVQVYQNVIQKNKRQVVLLHGCSGVGKTALVEKFREILCEANQGHFCAGKYFQNPGVQEPYSAITAAFSDLCDLVSQSQDFDEEKRLEISRQLGPDNNVLKKVISNISPFLDPLSGADVPVSDITDDSAMYKFKMACKAFLQAMTGNQPVVVFLDDIQWMDKGSLNLIEMYLSDSEMKNVMFILAYRDEEKEIVRNSLVTVKNDDFIDVPIQPLAADEVTMFIAGLMKTRVTNEIRRLGDLILKRTEGNPFYILQFMDAIEREMLLSYDAESSSWLYDVEKIQREVMTSDTLADLLLRRIKLLPDNEQETLKIASLLGYEFEESMLLKIAHLGSQNRREECNSGQSPTGIAMALVKATELGIVEKIHNGKSLQFSHDKLQTAFHAMLEESEEEQLQLIIGKFFLACGDEESKYHAAVHLNQAVGLINDPDSRINLVRVNLDAALYCKSRSAFDVSATLLRNGLSLLDGNDKWSINFDLAFEMTELLARMELTIGNLDCCKKLTKETLRRATSRDRKVNSLLIDVECQMAGNEMSSVVVTAFSALATLGIRMPHRIRAGNVVLKTLKLRRRLNGTTDEDILQLPSLGDSAIVAATRILVNLAFYCMLQDDDVTGAYSALCAAELTLLHGLSPNSATALIYYGSIELLFRHYRSAYRLGKLAMKMVDQVNCKDSECCATSLWVTTLAHWTEPLGDLRRSILSAVDAGFQAGDTVFTALAIANAFGMAFFLGDNLLELELFMRQMYNQLCDLSQQAMLLWAQPPFQTVLNFQGEFSNWCDATNLSGEIMNEAEYFRKAADSKHRVLMVIAWTYKGTLAFNFGFIEHAVQMYGGVSNIGKAFNSSFGALALYFYASLSYYQHYGKYGRARDLKKAREWQRKLEQIQARGNPNSDFVALLHAEALAMRKSSKPSAVRALFDRAIEVVAREKYTHFEALCNERAAFYFADRRMYDEAERYFARCIALFTKWGSAIKVEWLQEKLSILKGRRGEPARQETQEMLVEHIVVNI